MPSTTEVANAAFDRINESPISSIDGSDSKSQRAKRIFNYYIDMVIEKDHWVEGITRVSIDADVATPVNGYAYQYSLPADCRKPLRINDDDTLIWDREGSKIVTDLATPIILEYVGNTFASNPNLWSASFRETFTAYLAKEYAKAFSQDDRATERETREYKDSLNEGKARNAQVGSLSPPNITTLTTQVRKF